MTATWHILTGDYPPQPGGVSDYTAQVARGLAARGDTVHVWTRGDSSAESLEDGVIVHRVAGRFGPLTLRRLTRHWNAFPEPRRLFVQYVPYDFGWKGLNILFAVWLWWRRRWHGDSILTMFHEVWFPWVRRPLKHNVFAAAHRVMAFFVVRASRRCLVSTSAWEPLLKSVHKSADVAWRPIPAAITGPVDADQVRDYRAALPPGPVVAHFGTYGPLIHTLLTPTLAKLFESANAPTILLLGRGGEAYRQSLIAAHPEWAAKIVAAGALPAEQVAVALSAADVALQPYPDGASTRRTSLMAALALGVPVVTTVGRLSEPLWTASGLPVVPVDPAALADAVTTLLTDSEAQLKASGIGSALYADQFSLMRTLETLQQDAGFMS